MSSAERFGMKKDIAELVKKSAEELFGENSEDHKFYIKDLRKKAPKLADYLVDKFDPEKEKQALNELENIDCNVFNFDFGELLRALPLEIYISKGFYPGNVFNKIVEINQNKFKNIKTDNKLLRRVYSNMFSAAAGLRDVILIKGENDKPKSGVSIADWMGRPYSFPVSSEEVLLKILSESDANEFIPLVVRLRANDKDVDKRKRLKNKESQELAIRIARKYELLIINLRDFQENNLSEFDILRYIDDTVRAVYLRGYAHAYIYKKPQGGSDYVKYDKAKMNIVAYCHYGKNNGKDDKVNGIKKSEVKKNVYNCLVEIKCKTKDDRIITAAIYEKMVNDFFEELGPEARQYYLNNVTNPIDAAISLPW